MRAIEPIEARHRTVAHAGIATVATFVRSDELLAPTLHHLGHAVEHLATVVRRRTGPATERLARAHDRVAPFEGWTLPGVLGAGGAQALLKGSLVAPGDRHMICSSRGHIQLIHLPPVNGVRPAADVPFPSDGVPSPRTRRRGTIRMAANTAQPRYSGPLPPGATAAAERTGSPPLVTRAKPRLRMLR